MSDVHLSPVTAAARKILAEAGVLKESRLLLGTSGGPDSMVLLFMLADLNYDVTAAHVNYQLRGEESDADAELVKTWCATNGVPVLLKNVDTRQYALDHHKGIQAAARDIRYEWWDELKKTNSFDFVLTGHHHDDNIESVLINLMRGTGLKGLTGIPVMRDYYLRPLLRVTRKEIEEFAVEFQVPYRNDSSNQKDDYLRNKIRHHIIPAMRELVPEKDSLLKHSLLRIDLEWQSWQKNYTQWRNSIIIRDREYYVPASESDIPFVLRWLEEIGFPWNLAFDFIKSGPQKQGTSLQYGSMRLTSMTDGFHVSANPTFETCYFEKPGSYDTGEGELKIEMLGKMNPMATVLNKAEADASKFIEYVDADQLKWPLKLRAIQNGDSFQPLGMGGSSKKLQDFMVDEKMELHEKSRLRILEDHEKIVWVLGMRLDERIKLNTNTENIVKLTYTSNH